MWARLTSLVPWRKLLVFKKNDSPLARGRLQNAKWKEQCPNRIISELPNLSQKPGRLARENIEAAERAFCELGGPFGFLRATCGQRGQRVGITYDMAAAKFSTVWKSFQRIFHTLMRRQVKRSVLTDTAWHVLCVHALIRTRGGAAIAPVHDGVRRGALLSMDRTFHDA